SVSITSSTIAANTVAGGLGGPGSFGFGNGQPGAGRGGAVFTRGGSLSYGGSIIAGNGSADCAVSDTGALTTRGYHLLATAGGCSANGSTDQVAADPGVLPLADNGGPTFTHALAEASPAIDHGESGPCPADQRGTARPQGPACDIGAFERVPTVAELVVTTNADSGAGSLRKALEGANSHPGPDTITFALPAGQLTITPTAALPALSGPTIVDGLSQPGGPVTISGNGLAGDGLALAGGSTVRGLAISGFGGAGIAAGGTGGNIITANTITANGGPGVRVSAGTGNQISRNSIFRNGGIAVDLGGDGATPNDPGDGDTGANNLLNVPALAATDGTTSIDLSGTLDAPPGKYTIELYASEKCNLSPTSDGSRLSGPGEGETFLASAEMTKTSAAGSFYLSLTDLTLADQWFSAIARDADGNSSEFSTCTPIATNDLWTNARAIDLVADGSVRAGTESQSINRDYQERWYRFPVGPGSRVTVTLSGQPGVGMTLHRDLTRVYSSYLDLDQPLSAAAQSAQELPAGFLPAGFLPAGFLPAGFLPAGFLPAGFLPAGFLP
ncbi:MAG: right-handed parallel beta-helix repeat-containing protein, partial [Chloroflexales bacterium]|nr:right-handed parallel beta-helix repeat-containing protein [Chloroflexales bacterium]